MHKNKKLGLLHLQMAKELRADITSGIYANGDPFPSEMTLKAYYGVSRETIRAALALLQEEGLILRKRGSGTVVRSNVHRKMLSHIVDFHREAAMLGRKPSSRVISISSRKSRIRERILFDIPPGEEVVELRRLRSMDEVPVLLQTSSHPKDLFLGLMPEDLQDRSLYEFLRKEKGIFVRDADHVLEPLSAGPEEASLLQIPPGSAVILSHRITRDIHGRTIEIAENLVRGDYIKYSFRLRMDDGVG